jgi:hypothetical protein
MEAPDRDEREYELAAAILLLWLLMDTVWDTGAAWSVFREGFNQHVRPILTRIYGVARTSLAQQFGHQYQVTTAPSGNTVVQIPNLNRTIDQYERELFDTLQNRHTTQTQKQAERDRAVEVEPEVEHPPVAVFDEADAERISVTTVTEVNSQGEMDGAKDVETRVGTRLVGIWTTEPGACKVCAPLDGTIVGWSKEFPNGPPAHPRCRCSLQWRPFV